MYITVNDIKGDKRIDLAYTIHNSSKEVAVVSMFTDNIQYKFTGPRTINLGLRSKLIAAGTYMRRELTDLIERRIKLIQSDKDPRIKRTNQLEGITKVILTLDKLHNMNNLEDGPSGNTLLKYHMTAYE